MNVVIEKEHNRQSTTTLPTYKTMQNREANEPDMANRG